MRLNLVDPKVCRSEEWADAVDEIRAELSALGRLRGAEGETDTDSLSRLAREAATRGAWSEAGRLASARDHAPFSSGEAVADGSRGIDRARWRAGATACRVATDLMPLHFDRELNTRVHARDDGRCLSVENVAGTQAATGRATRGTPLEVAIAYLRALSPRLAYYHLSTMFTVVEHLGISLNTLFDGRARPVYVEPRGEAGYVDAQAHPRLQRGQIVGVAGFTFGDVAQCFGQSAISDAVDVRLLWHELSHAILMDTLHQRYLGFAHSFGDSLAALWCDPGTRASDRFATYPWTGISRRHLRLGARWSWKRWSATDDEEKLYDYEQILSTCMFRLYRVSGGDYGRPHLIIDDREAAVRRSASRYVMNLLIRAMHLQASAPFSPMSLPEHFVRALKQADEASDGFEEFPPGSLRKVIDWAFERQGLERQGPDVYLDDGSPGEYGRIEGRREATAKLYDEASWLSSAIGVEEPKPGEGPALPEIITRVGNRGSEDAEEVTLRVYSAPLGIGIAWADLELRNEVSLGRFEARTPSREVGPIAAETAGNEPTAPAGIVLELTTKRDESLPVHARAHTPPLGTKGSIPLSLIVPFDNNLAWLQRLHVTVPTSARFRHTFLVQNPLSRRMRIQLDVQMPHELEVDGWRLDVPSREILLGPGRRRNVALVLRAGAHAPSRGGSRIRVMGLAELDEQNEEHAYCAWPLGGFEIVVGHDVE